jgi:hypothetical protein
MSETDIKVNYFATEEQCICAHLPVTPELVIPFTALKTNIYEKYSFPWPTLITLRQTYLCWIFLAHAGSKKTSIGIHDVRAVTLVVMRVALYRVGN